MGESVYNLQGLKRIGGKMKRCIVTGLTVAAFLTVALFRAPAGRAAPDLGQIERRVSDLEKRVATLEEWFREVENAASALQALLKEQAGAGVAAGVTAGRQTWTCHSLQDELRREVYGETPETTLTLTAAGDTGAVYVSSVQWQASHSVQGIKRRWDFGPGGVYAITLDPDGRAAYFDFTGRKGERINAERIYQCQKR